MIMGAVILAQYLKSQDIALPPRIAPITSGGMMLWAMLNTIGGLLSLPRRPPTGESSLAVIAMPAGLAIATGVAALVWNQRPPLPTGVIVLFIGASVVSILLLIRFTRRKSAKEAISNPDT